MLLTVAISLIDNGNLNVKVRQVGVVDVRLGAHAGRVSLAQIEQIDSSRQACIAAAENEDTHSVGCVRE